MLEEGAACQAGAGAGRNCCRPGAAETFARWGTFAWGWGAGRRTGRKGAKESLAFCSPARRPQSQPAKAGPGLGGGETGGADDRKLKDISALRPRCGLGAGHPRNGKPQCRGRGLGRGLGGRLADGGGENWKRMREGEEGPQLGKERIGIGTRNKGGVSRTRAGEEGAQSFSGF